MSGSMCLQLLQQIGFGNIIRSSVADGKFPSKSKNPKSAVPDGKALSFARTQLGHNLSLLISLANEGGEVKG